MSEVSKIIYTDQTIEIRVGRAIQSADKINFATIGIQAEADSAYESLVNRVKPFENKLRQQVKSIESLELQSMKLLFFWPRLTNLWNKIILDASIYSKRAAEYAEEAALHKGTDDIEDEARSELPTDGHDEMKSGHILFSYSKLLFGDITSVYPDIKFVETDLLSYKVLCALMLFKHTKYFVLTYVRYQQKT